MHKAPRWPQLGPQKVPRCLEDAPKMAPKTAPEDPKHVPRQAQNTCKEQLQETRKGNPVETTKTLRNQKQIDVFAFPEHHGRLRFGLMARGCGLITGALNLLESQTDTNISERRSMKTAKVPGTPNQSPGGAA